MRIIGVTASLAAISTTLSGCSKSDLDRCIDDQMAVWKQQEQSYQEQMKNYTPPASENRTVNVGGVEIDPSMLPPLGNPGTKEEAEARANLQCGKVYAKGS